MQLMCLTAAIGTILIGFVSGQFSYGSQFQASGFSPGAQASNVNNFQNPRHPGSAFNPNSNGEIPGGNTQGNAQGALAGATAFSGANVPRGNFPSRGSPFNSAGAFQPSPGNRYNNPQNSPVNRSPQQSFPAAPSNQGFRGNAPNGNFPPRFNPLNSANIYQPSPQNRYNNPPNPQGSPINRPHLPAYPSAPSNQASMPGNVPSANRNPYFNHPFPGLNNNHAQTKSFVPPAQNTAQQPPLDLASLLASILGKPSNDNAKRNAFPVSQQRSVLGPSLNGPMNANGNIPVRENMNPNLKTGIDNGQSKGNTGPQVNNNKAIFAPPVPDDIESSLLSSLLSTDAPDKKSESSIPDGFVLDMLSDLLPDITEGPINQESSTKSTGTPSPSTSYSTTSDGLTTSTTFTTTPASLTSVTESQESYSTTTETCGEDEDWWPCMPLHHNTCETFARAYAHQDFVCESGCFCRVGLIKTKDGSCVEPNDCPVPVCDGYKEEPTDCVNQCNTCEAMCGACELKKCQPGCDCLGGFKRDANGTCIPATKCPICTTASPTSADTSDDFISIETTTE